MWLSKYPFMMVDRSCKCPEPVVVVSKCTCVAGTSMVAEVEVFVCTEANEKVGPAGQHSLVDNFLATGR